MLLHYIGTRSCCHWTSCPQVVFVWDRMGMGLGMDEVAAGGSGDRGTSADSIPIPYHPPTRPVCRRLSFIKWWSCAYFNMAALNLSGVRSIMTEVGGRTRGAWDAIWGPTDTQRSRDGWRVGSTVPPVTGFEMGWVGSEARKEII